MSTNRSRREAAWHPESARAAGNREALRPGPRLAVALVRLDDLTIDAINVAGHELAGRPLDDLLGRPIVELIDPRDRGAALTALSAMRGPSIDFVRLHGLATPPRRPPVPFVAWVRPIVLDVPYALVLWIRRVDGEWWTPGGSDQGRMLGIAVIGADGYVKTAWALPEAADSVAPSDLVGRRLLPPLAGAVTAGAPVGAPAGDPSASGVALLDGRGPAGLDVTVAVTPLAGSSDRIVGLLAPPPPSRREVDLEAHLWRIAAEIEATGIPVGPRPADRPSLTGVRDAATLTPRQWEVLRRLLAGQRVPAIAAGLFVSQSTVRNHLAAIFDRFGVHSQAELLAHLSGPLEPSSETDGVSMA